MSTPLEDYYKQHQEMCALRVKRRFEALINKIMTKVLIDPETGCWEWQGLLSGRGYGIIGLKLVHRIMLEYKLGRPIGKGMQACHKCDNPPCVNPDDLFEGTLSDNMKDAYKKGRLHNPRSRSVRARLSSTTDDL